MNSKELINNYVFNKPTIIDIFCFFLILFSVFLLHFVIGSFPTPNTTLMLIGFGISGYLVGLSLAKTKNVLFPIGIIIVYNVTVSIQSDVWFLVLDESRIFQIVLYSIRDALYLVFVIYLVVLTIRSIIAIFKNIHDITKIPVTIFQFIIASAVAGFLYGILMVIQPI